MTLNELAYRRGSSDAFQKFAALGAPAMPGAAAAGSLGAVPPISTAVPGMMAGAAKPGAPNQALSTTPVLGTGVPGTPTISSMGKTQAQGSVISAPPAAAPATPSIAKAASLYAPAPPPKSAKIPRATSTVGSNSTTETVKSVSPPSPAPVGSAATSSSSSAPAAAGAAGQQLGGIVPSTGQSPAATLANETASNTRNQVVSVSGGGK
jgi:hypothetical protein